MLRLFQNLQAHRDLACLFISMTSRPSSRSAAA
jgi:hypothetical protein